MPTLHLALWLVAAVLFALAAVGAGHERINLTAAGLCALTLGLLIQ